MKLLGKIISIDNIAIVPIFLSILLVYQKLFVTYFQGDEWTYFSVFLPLTRIWNGLLLAIFKGLVDADTISGGGHLTPIYTSMWFIQNYLFGLQYSPYVIVSLVIHALNTFIVFKLGLLYTRKRIFSFFSALFFGLSANHAQAITWIMAVIPTQLSVFFGLLSLYTISVFFKTRNKLNSFSFVSSYLFLWCALFSKETAVILFLIFPILSLVFNYEKKKLFLVTTANLVCYIIFRFVLPIVLFPLATKGDYSVLEYQLLIVRLITYTLRVVTQVFVPSKSVLDLAEYLTQYLYPIYATEMNVRGLQFLQFTQSAGSDVIFFFFSGLLLGLLIYVYSLLKSRLTIYKKNFMLGVLIILTTSFPLLFIALYAPWWGYVTFIDPRHLYFGSVGGAYIFGTVCVLLFHYSGRIERRLVKVLLYFLLCFGIAYWTFSHVNIIDVQLSQEVSTAEKRKYIIDSIIKSISLSEKKKIIYVKSPYGYYGFANIPPFQTSLGQILAVHYFQLRTLPKEFLESNFFTLGNSLGEGVLEKDEHQFGYFVNESLLNKQIIEGRISPENVYAFEWNDEKNILTDITEITKKRLSTLARNVQNTKDWKKYEVNSFSISFPNDFFSNKVSERNLHFSNVEKIYGENILVSITSMKKPKDIVFHEFVETKIFDTQGKSVGGNLKIRNIDLTDGSLLTVVEVNNQPTIRYLIPSKNGEFYIDFELFTDITTKKAETANKQYLVTFAEQLLSTIRLSSEK